jgi:NADH-quinone oxidoreductase subunit E
MKRYDLRREKGGFEKRLFEILKSSAHGEAVIFLFEKVGEEQLKELITKIRAAGDDVLNSLKYNEADWTIVVRISNV